MKKLKGSATLIVVISAIVFTIYAGAASAEAMNAEYMQKDIKQKVKEIYEKDIENLQEIYDNITKIK